MAEPNKEITEALTALADKLGTTAEHLWSIMVAARPAIAAWGLIKISIGVVFVICAAKLFNKSFAMTHSAEHTEDDGWPVVLALGGVIMALAGFFFMVLPIPGVIYAVFAPEYSVIREILGVIKN